MDTPRFDPFPIFTQPQGFRYESEVAIAAVQDQIDLSTLSLRVMLVDMAIYRPDSSHQKLSQIPPEAKCADDVALQGVTFVGYVLDGENVYFTNVTPGAYLGLVFYVDSGKGREHDDLLCFRELREVGNGGDLEVKWDDGPLKIGKFLPLSNS